MSAKVHACPNVRIPHCVPALFIVKEGLIIGAIEPEAIDGQWTECSGVKARAGIAHILHPLICGLLLVMLSKPKQLVLNNEKQGI
jgi:hypothetical protein